MPCTDATTKATDSASTSFSGRGRYRPGGPSWRSTWAASWISVLTTAASSISERTATGPGVPAGLAVGAGQLGGVGHGLDRETSLLDQAPDGLPQARGSFVPRGGEDWAEPEAPAPWVCEASNTYSTLNPRSTMLRCSTSPVAGASPRWSRRVFPSASTALRRSLMDGREHGVAPLALLDHPA